MKQLLLSILLLAAACAPEPVISSIDVKIVEVYREFKMGADNGTTVVELADKTRIKLTGRLGKQGETIRLKTVDGRIIN